MVLGTGSRVQRVPPAVSELLKRKGINLEIQDTVRDTVSFPDRRGHSLIPRPERLGTGLEATLVSVWEASMHQLRFSLSFQPNACATFNFLLEEGRPAGAALIPPEYIPP